MIRDEAQIAELGGYVRHPTTPEFARLAWHAGGEHAILARTMPEFVAVATGR
jgi:hypothetical protein